MSVSDHEWEELRTLSEELKTERDEADRRAGAAERRLAELEESARRQRAWLENAKADAGYHTNESFDVVWAAALAALLREREM